VIGTVYVAIALPCPRYVRTFTLSGGGLGRDVTGTCIRIASPVFSLVADGWLGNARWRTLRPCGPDGLQVLPGCLVGFSSGSPLGSFEDTR
jgi:hypothetical protein